MVADPPVFRMVLVVVIATALGAALSVLPRSGLPRPAVHAAALVAFLVAAALALAAAGLPRPAARPRRLGRAGRPARRRPGGHPHGGVALRGRGAVGAAGDPARRPRHAGARRGAGVLARPPRPRRSCAPSGLVALLALYGTAVTEHDPGSPLLRGLALFLLVAAWLWLPRLRAKEARAAAVTVLAVGLLALPAAARLDAEAAVIDYQAWNWFGGKDVTFDWNHSYGPLDWSREGTTLLQVRSSKPLYWKAETLDSFDGLRWVRSPANDRTGPGGELPRRARPALGRELQGDRALPAHGLRDRRRHAVPGDRRGRRRERLGRRHAAKARRAARARRQLPRARLRSRSQRSRDAPGAGELRLGPPPVHARLPARSPGENALRRDLDRAGLAARRPGDGAADRQRRVRRAPSTARWRHPTTPGPTGSPGG